MKSLYLLLDLAAIAGPLALSFDKKVHYFTKWKFVLLSSLIVACPFLIWDSLFTEYGVWGFNEDYLTGVSLGNLPIEEVLFFIVVPFSCTFIYECCKYYFKKWNARSFDLILKTGLLVYLILVFLQNPLGTYTLTNSIVGLVVLIYWFINIKYKFIGITFLLSLIPFLIMNGILTGIATESPIVWYENLENSSLRILTIPMEDTIYGMSLILSVIFVYEKLLERFAHELRK